MVTPLPTIPADESRDIVMMFAARTMTQWMTGDGVTSGCMCWKNLQGSLTERLTVPKVTVYWESYLSVASTGACDKEQNNLFPPNFMY